ncbi:hypothetical protein CQW23_07930 [Capsicum baccatum]|uniref:Uncharacterized protein n=1 Tax=Capsicum baccatum TaxID=33114 RepID=A0A2G2X7I5_CAPBA|nr:hypothetical protein CQW23_07930 [Capsicum baccatum]
MPVAVRVSARVMTTMVLAKREYPVASIFNLIAKRFIEKFRERRAYVLNYKDNLFVPPTKKIKRNNMSEGESLYMENVNGDDNQFTVFGRGSTAIVNLLKKSCSWRKYDLIKFYAPTRWLLCTKDLKFESNIAVSRLTIELMARRWPDGPSRGSLLKPDGQVDGPLEVQRSVTWTVVDLVLSV